MCYISHILNHSFFFPASSKCIINMQYASSLSSSILPSKIRRNSEYNLATMNFLSQEDTSATSSTMTHPSIYYTIYYTSTVLLHLLLFITNMHTSLCLNQMLSVNYSTAIVPELLPLCKELWLSCTPLVAYMNPHHNLKIWHDTCIFTNL